MLRTYAELEQGTDEWIAARCGIPTASVIGQLITPRTVKPAANDTARALTETLIAERLTGRVEYLHPTRDMERGTLLEPFARDLYGMHYAPVSELGFMVRDDWGYQIGYSPDGLVGTDGLIEIKSRKPKIQLRTILDDTVPLGNMAQLQVGLLVADRAWIDYVSYCPGMKLYVKRVYPDPKWAAAIVAAIDAFEVNAADAINDFRARTEHMPDTPYFDPFEDEVMTFG